MRRSSPRGARRGVYPLLVKVLLVTVIVVLSLMVASYVLFLVTSTREHFELRPMLYITQTSLGPRPVVRLYVINEGAKSEAIARVEIVTGGGTYVCNPEPEIVIEAGFRGYILVGSEEEGTRSFSCSWVKYGSPVIAEGDLYTVKLYTAHHGVMTFPAQAQSG